MKLLDYMRMVFRVGDTGDIRVDLNDLAKAVTLEEGLKESVNIAQVKEILKITFTQMAKLEDKEVRYILNKYKES